MIRDAVGKICSRFDDAYWLKKDKEGGYPADFHRALADAGWLGICIPEEYGGSGLGITDAAIMMRTIAESGAGMSGASAVHMNVFGLNPVVVFGTREQCTRMLPPIIDGRDKSCFAVTEPNTGLNTTQLKTRAVRKGDKYVVNGQKVWISTAQVANKISVLLARTTPLEEVKTPTQGLSLFYTDFDKKRVAVHEIEKMGRKPVDFNDVVLREFRDPGRGPPRRGRPRLRIHPARDESRAYPDRGGSRRSRPDRAVARCGLCEEPHRLQPSDRHESRHPASAGEELDGTGSRLDDGAARWLAIRSGHAMRPGRQCREISRRGSRLPRLRAGCHDAWRLWIRQGISRRALCVGLNVTARTKASSLDSRSKAAQAALDDAGLKRADIDGICGYSTVSPHIMLWQLCSPTTSASACPMPYAVQVAVPSASRCTMSAHHLVASGVCRNALVVAGEVAFTGQSQRCLDPGAGAGRPSRLPGAAGADHSRLSRSRRRRATCTNTA